MPLANGERGNSRGNSINGRASKDRRRAEAFAREAAASELSIAEKLAKLPANGAKRQRAKYTVLLAEQTERASQTSQLVKDAKTMVENGEAVSLSEAKRKITEKKKIKTT